MKHLFSGQHFGANKRTLKLDDCILTEASYVPEISVPWHYHENVYFYYHLKGNLVEVNKKKSFICKPGTILFHNWQDPHYNTKFSTDASFLHVELEKGWFEKHLLKADRLSGSNQLNDPGYRSFFIKIYKEFKINDSLTQCSVEGILLQAVAEMLRLSSISDSNPPNWVRKIKEIFHENLTDKITLRFLANETNIHPVYLSREFPKYFNMNFGEYYRKTKLERSVQLLNERKLSLTEIAYECGYADQSHFIRVFKSAYGITPSRYRAT